MLGVIGVMKPTGLTFMFVLVLRIGKTKSVTKSDTTLVYE